MLEFYIAIDKPDGLMRQHGDQYKKGTNGHALIRPLF
jgi:hypothetical protein